MVLDNDDLLREILFRLAFPVSLIYAALVCKRWLSIASDPDFLRRFRKLHPPLLGFYLKCRKLPFPKFVAMPHTEELSTIICRAESVFKNYSVTWGLHFHSRNSRLLGKFYGHGSVTNVVLSPLNLENNMVTLPPLPSPGHELDMIRCAGGYLLNDQGCFCTLLVHSQERTSVQLYELVDGLWKNHTSSAVVGCPLSWTGIKGLLAKHWPYLVIKLQNKILALNLMSSVLSVVELPKEVEGKHNLELSLADDTGFNLVHVRELELRVWLYNHMTEGSSVSVGGNWLLLHTICLRDVSTNLRMPTPVLENGQNAAVKLHTVGDNAEFVFLEMCDTVVYLDSVGRVAEKVFTLAQDDGDIYRIHPFMRIWPPTFPGAQRKTGAMGMVWPERAPVNGNQPEVLSLPQGSHGDASGSRSFVEQMASSKRRCIG